MAAALALLATLVCTAAQVSGAAALPARAGARATVADGHLQAHLSGLPPAPELRFAAAAVVAGETGSVSAALPVNAHGFSALLPAGPYVAALSAGSSRGVSYTGVSALARVKSGATTVVAVAMHRASAKAAPARLRALPRPHARAAASGAIYTMGPVTLTAAPHAPLPSYQLSDHVLSAIFDSCSAAGTR
ncbi:MAG TPA: hypothetical protein VMB51_11250, partial [Solirubrobacteraceae bacterium]|nr:hypothetical protein [Solirubrobacteraceae bacterium]